MANSLMDSIYGPLNKEYCIYFYILSVIGFMLMIVSILSTLFIGITKQKNSKFYAEMFMISIMYGLIYFHNRLLHSICTSSFNNK